MPAGHRRADTVEANAGAYLGTITRVTGATAYVELPRLAAGFEYGPAGYPSEYAQAGETPLEVGDRVAVAFLEGGRDDVVVLLRLA